jgi:hypothetical protein
MSRASEGAARTAHAVRSPLAPASAAAGVHDRSRMT